MENLSDKDISELAPKILSKVFIKRMLKTNYINGADAKAYTTVVEIEWNGERYALGLYKL